MSPMQATGLARKYMEDFARATALDPPGNQPRRYLWTDAFAVCNYLGLYKENGDLTCRDLAQRLIGQVHHILGRYRDDDPRDGWISGLLPEEGELHPTIGGLRIGKSLPERRSGEPYDNQEEWDRDGQYFHYLVQWMHALNRAGMILQNPIYNVWAIELARTAHARFTYRAGGRMRMFWKMSTDLSRPLVSSMGQLDPLEGLVTCAELQLAAGRGMGQQVLEQEMTDMAGMVHDIPPATDDPLGIGGLLSCAARIVRLTIQGGIPYPGLLESVTTAALCGLESFTLNCCLDLPARSRLAFRELGLSIGLAGIEPLPALIEKNSLMFEGQENVIRSVQELQNYMDLKVSIEKFWLAEENQASVTWIGHKEINMVMLATSLAPYGFIDI